MLQIVDGSVFDYPAQTIVNTVNCVGIMGGGLAKVCKDRWPEMFREYRQRCDDGRLEPGILHLWKGPDQWVLNFPTKGHWRWNSQLDWIDKGLANLARNYEAMGITDLNIPLLGCSKGKLDPDDVIQLIKDHLGYRRSLTVRLCTHHA